MRANFEVSIIANPLLGAVCLWEFVRKYESHRQPAEFPSVLHLLPVLPIVYRKSSAEKLRNMQFDSGLSRFLNQDQTILNDLARRVGYWSRLTLDSINIACAASLLSRVENDAAIRFASSRKNLPSEIAPMGVASDRALAARRLGAFFRDESLVQLQSKLRLYLQS